MAFVSDRIFATRPNLLSAAFCRAVTALLVLLLLLQAASTSSGGACGKDDAPKGPQTVAEQLPGLHLLQGPWEPGSIYRESVMFVQTGDGRPTAKLLFDAEKVTAVHSADGMHAFEADKDFQVTPDGSGLLLTAASRIPFRKHSDLFPPKGSPNSIGHKAGQPDTSLLFGEGHVFHDQQVEVTYVPRKEAKWTGYTPIFAEKRLPATLDKLRNKKALTIAVSGDSISQGYNASGYTKAPPFMPAYPNLVAAQLEKTFGATVELHNRAIAGWSVGQGVKDLDNLLKSKPDLVIIAYGMNDVGGRNPDGFKSSIATMLRRIKEANAATEVILVASMMGNPDWAATPPEMFPRYRDALASLEGPGVVLADLTAIWQKLLERKRFVDMTGNGVNHPNDYGHRLYAQAILALLVPPDPVRRDPPPKPTRHVEQLIEGWTVHVDDRLLMGPDAEVGKRAIQILTMRLVDIKIALPADKVARLQKVPIWLDRTHGKLKPAQYHPSSRWLKTNGYDEALAKCVHIPDAAEFASPGHQRVQPWSVLHELAHAYHDQVLGFDHAEIAAAWKRFKDSGRYEKVLHINGSTTRHYGLTNPQEFFAEMTESYFGTNDFFPFNRAELRREEPEIFALLTRIWHEKHAPD